MYPDTEIVYETGEGAEGSITTADRIRALNARLLSGDGPDILLMDGLSSDSYISKGILADLSPMLGEAMGYLTDKYSLSESVDAAASKIQLYLYEQ